MDFLIRKHLWIDISQGKKNHPLVGKKRHAVHRYRFLSTLHGSGALKHPCSLTDQLPVLPESSGGVHDGFHLGWNPSISGRNPEHDPVIGHDIQNLQPEEISRLGIGLVPQGRRLFPNLTVEENLQIGALKRQGNDGVTWTHEHLFEQFPRIKVTIKSG